MQRVIKLTIPLKGISTGQRQITLETSGFQGESCLTATAAFEKALGTVTDTQLTQEYYETAPQHESHSEGGPGG